MLQPLHGMPGPPPRAAAPPPAAAPSASGWTEHTAPDGRKYYYHKAKGVSAWAKPEELKTEEERAATAATSSKWKEYTHSNGKKYFFNTETRVTTWEMPEELKQAAEAAAAKAPTIAAPAKGPWLEPTIATPAAAAPSAAAPSSAAGAADGATDEEKVMQFMKMLDDGGVTETMSWDDAMKKVINNPTYRVLATLAERKAAFVQWQEARRERVDEEERKKLRQVKVGFLSMLKECDELTSRTRYGRVAQLFERDARWQALDDELEREELFEEYSLSLERKEKVERAARRKERMGAFKALLDERHVGVRAQWRKVQQQLEDEPAFRALEKIDRLSVFEEHIRELEAKAEQEKQRDKEAQRRHDRRKRDAFRAELQRLNDGGALSLRSEWRDVMGGLMATDAYRGCCEQQGSTPAELFEDFVEQLSETFGAQRKAVRAALGAAADGAAPTEQTTTAEFEAVVRAADAQGLAAVPASAVAMVLEELQMELADKRREEEKRAARKRQAARETFTNTLRGLMGATLSASTTWDDAAKVMEGKPFAQALDEAERKSAFAELVASLGDDDEGALPDGKDKGGGAEQAGEEDDGKDGNKKRKKEKRHRSHHDDEDEEERERRHKRKKEKRERREPERTGEEGQGAD